MAGGVPLSTDRDKRVRVNRQIRISPVRVITAEGEQLGVLPIEEALAAAQDRGLDLVEVAPTARPPVVKIMDYGKFKFEEAKAARAAKKKQHVIQLKEVKYRPGIDDHDFDFKTRHAREFLGDGNKVKVTLMFRGRQLAHIDLGRAVLDRVIAALADVGKVEQLMGEMGYHAAFVGTGAGSPKFLASPARPNGQVFSANEFLTRVNLMRGDRQPLTIRRSAWASAWRWSARAIPPWTAARGHAHGRRPCVRLPPSEARIAGARRGAAPRHRRGHPVPVAHPPGGDPGDADGWVARHDECQKMELGEPDASGRRRPVPPDEFVELECDTVIYALGTKANPIIAQTTPGLALNKWGYIDADDATQAPTCPACSPAAISSPAPPP